MLNCYNAEIARGKASGLYVVRQELAGKDGFPLRVPDIVVNFIEPKKPEEDSSVGNDAL
jgi:hypothetical protein